MTQNHLSCIPTKNILSFWIIVYFILYCCELVPFNPLLLVILCIFFQLITIFCYYIFNNKLDSKLCYLIIILIIKIICLYFIYNIKITCDDVCFSIIFILVYNLYISYSDENIFYIYFDLLLHNINGNGRISCIEENYNTLINKL